MGDKDNEEKPFFPNTKCAEMYYLFISDLYNCGIFYLTNEFEKNIIERINKLYSTESGKKQ